MALRLTDLDLTKQIDSKSEYKEKLKELQLDLLHYQRKILESKRSIMLIFEGPDAAGKGGVIKRITERTDPRLLRVYSVIKPTSEEYKRHYLWRFWTRIPPYGQIAIFDRSWYGRVLVEKIENFATKEEWSRAYKEINNFEKTLSDDGAILLKFYIHISKEEQLSRFKARQANPYKHWKINDEDWRNRRKWDEYTQAAEEVFKLTSTKEAPWHLIEGEFKWYARIKVLKTLVKRVHEEFA
ncbi:MAG: UDP-galactose-lipid carrier transferase [Verrucomicrobiota bacterium]|nr:UDP-galactose-lipid carrier transferase [Verrucomicrobiota bacterium]